ncbi:MAG: ABC transporter permease [Planctomycetaceae bacterium]|jgi:putative ABC transport system permease protein|nr:ABC transporter permease [Planctomycetaceae bacterium]
MKLWQIAWKSIEHRRLASILTAFSMSLGVALIVTVIVIYGILNDSFNKSAQGYDIVVGPKGSALELVMATMFYSQGVPDTIPYDYYRQLATGRYSTEVETAVPIALADSYKGIPVVATTHDFFSKLEYRDRKTYSFRDGNNLDAGEDYCAVVGYSAARRLKLKLGDEFLPTALERRLRGETGIKKFRIVGILDYTATPNDSAIFINLAGFFDVYSYGKEGGLAAVLSSDGKSRGVGEGGGEMSGNDLKFKEKRISAVLVLTKEKAAAIKTRSSIWFDARQSANMGSRTEGDIESLKLDRLTTPEMSPAVFALQQRISSDLDAQAIRPIEQIAFLLEKIVGNLQLVLIILAVLVVVVAGIGMMVSIYNSMNERRQEIAIMRALGARRTTVMGIILLESILLSLGGGLLGIVIGHSLIMVIGPFISDAVNIAVSPWRFQLTELILVPGLMALASLVGYLPAVVAYRTDVAQSL